MREPRWSERRRERLARLLPPAMARSGLRAWLVLTRENHPDPLARDVGLEHAVGRAAGLFLLRDGGLESAAMVAGYDVSPVEEAGIYDRIIPYGAEGARTALKDLIREAGVEELAINVSRDSSIADGLTAGLRDWLGEVLAELENAPEIIAAEETVAAFRSSRLPEEIDLYREAVRRTDAMIAAVLSSEVIEPGRTTEKDVAVALHRRLREEGLEPSWHADHCPNVWTRLRGHGGPGDRVIERGDLVSVDFGIEIEGLRTDLQRSAYVLDGGRDRAPEDIERLWEAAAAANRAAVEAMAPGVRGVDVDAAARAALSDRGFEEYGHATGHALGFCTHEIGPLLGPDWPDRYGRAVFRALEADQIYAVEPSARIEGADGEVGTGLEEDVLATEEGAEYLSPVPGELPLV